MAILYSFLQDYLAMRRGGEKVYSTENPVIIHNRIQAGEFLGKGSWGEVYYAKDLVTNQKGAIKISKLTERARSQMERRKLKEGGLLFDEFISGGVGCANVVQGYYEEDSTGVPFIWMPGEYILTLKQATNEIVLHFGDYSGISTQNKLINLGSKMRLASGVFNAVSKIHTKCEITHGDINPLNFLVDKGGEAFLIDFGCSSLIPIENWSSSPREMMGSRGIMAPELYHEGSHPTPRSDVYSTGATLFSVLENRELRGPRIKCSEDPDKELRGLTEKDADEEVAEEVKHFPRDLRNFLKRSLSFDPKKRYKDGRELKKVFDVLERRYDPERLRGGGAVTKTLLEAVENTTTTLAFKLSSLKRRILKGDQKRLTDIDLW